MRFIGLDVHRDFCEVAIKDESGLRLAGRVKTSVEELELFAASLGADDQVALEATGQALQIARILEPHVGRVVVANTRKCSAIAESKVKTDKLAFVSQAAGSRSTGAEASAVRRCPVCGAPLEGRRRQTRYCSGK